MIPGAKLNVSQAGNPRPTWEQTTESLARRPGRVFWGGATLKRPVSASPAPPNNSGIVLIRAGGKRGDCETLAQVTYLTIAMAGGRGEGFSQPTDHEVWPQPRNLPRNFLSQNIHRAAALDQRRGPRGCTRNTGELLGDLVIYLSSQPIQWGFFRLHFHSHLMNGIVIWYSLHPSNSSPDPFQKEALI